MHELPLLSLRISARHLYRIAYGISTASEMVRRPCRKRWAGSPASAIRKLPMYTVTMLSWRIVQGLQNRKRRLEKFHELFRLPLQDHVQVWSPIVQKLESDFLVPENPSIHFRPPFEDYPLVS
jgi:hypothetical protein